MKLILDEKVPIKIWTNDIEAEAITQLKNLSTLPFIYKHLAVMPDVHVGRGSTVGTVVATKGAILPSCVGVDLGCGMAAVKLPFKIDVFTDLKKLRNSLERSIPVGFQQNHRVTDRVLSTMASLGNPQLNIKLDKASKQLGSLGGGNHFIEVCKDQNNDAWLMLHSGSRNIGNVLAEVHIDKAKELMKRYFIDLPDPDLAYLVQDTQEFKAYIADMQWAQNYAMQNREEMLKRALKDISFFVFGEDKGEDYMTVLKVNCHHNYTQMEHHFGNNVWITRKGAVSARQGQLGIIPGSMGAKSFIVEGLGNEQSFHSCSHGAGRKMSRSKARKTFTNDDLMKQTEGIECRKDDGVLDEIPGAYKNIDEVMENQVDLVKPIYTLNQLMVIKG